MITTSVNNEPYQTNPGNLLSASATTSTTGVWGVASSQGVLSRPWIFGLYIDTLDGDSMGLGGLARGYRRCNNPMPQEPDQDSENPAYARRLSSNLDIQDDFRRFAISV
jgi:hypothetical protein